MHPVPGPLSSSSSYRTQGDFHSTVSTTDKGDLLLFFPISALAPGRICPDSQPLGRWHVSFTSVTPIRVMGVKAVWETRFITSPFVLSNDQRTASHFCLLLKIEMFHSMYCDYTPHTLPSPPFLSSPLAPYPLSLFRKQTGIFRRGSGNYSYSHLLISSMR